MVQVGLRWTCVHIVLCAQVEREAARATAVAPHIPLVTFVLRQLPGALALGPSTRLVRAESAVVVLAAGDVGRSAPLDSVVQRVEQRD